VTYYSHKIRRQKCRNFWNRTFSTLLIKVPKEKTFKSFSKFVKKNYRNEKNGIKMEL
jgi:hypothetical protein